MTRPDLIIMKMGGSVVTVKDSPLTANLTAIDGISKIVLELRKKYKVIIVHGGGSFGHYWSVKYDMHTKPLPYSDEGISIVHESMIQLNHIIIKKFIENRLKPYTLQPSTFVYRGLPDSDKIESILDITTKNDIVPVTFGDVIHTTENNFSILSGDTIMSLLATKLHPKYCMFLTNVDGLFGDINKRDLLHEVQLDNLVSLVTKTNTRSSDGDTDNSPFDVTGGMKRKVSESIPIVKSGTPVYFLNGFEPQRMLDIIEGKDYVGTCFKLKPISQI
ncbi:MAG: isopentenyl phosphate kinase [Candidatus Nitrosocosmicus sp.]|jgi:isopentenyl phosphate kinase|nr:isopentenyl phosphate kinase [Candidatus Nitrosocosmicus sp.]